MNQMESVRYKMPQADGDTPAANETISLLDILSVLVRRRWLIVGSSGLAAVLAVAVSVITLVLPPDSPWNPLPNFYRPMVKAMLQDAKDSLSSRLGSTGVISGILGGVPVANPNVILAQEILAGNTLRDQIVEEFHFLEKYGLQDTEFPKTEARKAFSEALGASFGETATGSSNILSLSYKNIDREFATRVVARVVEILGQRFKDLTMERVYQKKAFIEGRMAAVEQSLKDAQSDLETFQLDHGVIDIASQTTEQARLLSSLRSDVIRGELEIQTLRTYLSESDPKIVRLRQEIRKKNELIDQLKTGPEERAAEFIPQNLIPSLTNRFAELKAEIGVLEKIYGTLRQEYEAVKIEEADNTQTFQIIEPAEVPEVKAGPFRSKICMYVTAITFALSLLAAFILDYFEKAKKDPVESAKLDGMRLAIGRRK
jgi:uncharacterized protein involved in exopolysaccharide biosynthesis